MNRPEAILAGMALAILGSIGAALIFHAVPQENRELLSTIEGAVAGALMMRGGQKLADTISARDATVGRPTPAPRSLMGGK